MSEVSDNRDLRDPAEYAKALRRMVMTRADCTCMRHAQDIGTEIGLTTPNYTSEPVDHSKDRTKELHARAPDGHRFARAILNGSYAGEEPVD